MTSPFSPAKIDELLVDHLTLACVDQTIGTLRALGLEPRPATIREQAALQEREPAEVELLVALIGRRLSSLEGAQ